MRRARGPTYHNHFTTEKKLRWRCNICKRRKRRVLTREQAKVHGGSAKHCSKAETATFFKNPRNFTAIEIWKWRCNICLGKGRAMSRGRARIHEAKKKHYSRVATTLFNRPGSFKYAGNGKWRCHVCKVAAMTVEGAKAHEFLCQRPNSDLQVASSAGHNSAAYLGLLSSLWWTSTRNVASLRANERLEVAESDSEAGSLDRSLDDQSEGNCNNDGDDSCNDSDDDDDDEGEGDEDENDEDEDDNNADNNNADNNNADNDNTDNNNADNDNADNDNADNDNADNDNADNDNADNDSAEDNDDNADNVNADNNNHIADDDDDHDDATFVENFLRCNDVNADRRKRLRSFYKMSADQKIQKIQEMLRGQ